MKRILLRYRIAFRILVLSIIFSLVTGISIQNTNPVTAAPVIAKYLVMIVIDGGRPDYLSLVPTPNIDALKLEGITYENSWVGQLNNDTPPGHTTISTGRFGRNNGVIGFGWRKERLLPSNWDLQIALSKFVLNVIRTTGWTDLGLWFQDNVIRNSVGQNFPTTWQNVKAGVFTSFIRDSGATSIGAEYKKTYPGAKVAAISCDKWYAVAGLAADSADYTVFADSCGIPPITYSSLTKIKPAGMTEFPPPDYVINDATLVRDVLDICDTDTWATDVALAMIRKTQPEILLLNLPATDDAGHESGGINAPEVMGKVIDNVDRQIGRIINEYKQSNKYDETVFVILSDHGMTPVIRSVSQATLDRIYVDSGNFGVYSSQVYLINPLQSREVAENIADSSIPGVLGAYYKILQMDNTYSYEPTRITKTKITGDLDKAYRYLLSTFVSEKSPDIELITAENWHIDFKTGGGKIFYGNHDSTSWLQQNNLLMIAGPGVIKGAVSESPARLVDVAPTVLTLLGILPDKMDGITLADALQMPSSSQVRDQLNLNKELMPLIEALKSQSNSDIASLFHK
jgi:predicted AlkP superfamily pyrophosphatase or phosphodiesterase